MKTITGQVTGYICDGYIQRRSPVGYVASHNVGSYNVLCFEQQDGEKDDEVPEEEEILRLRKMVCRKLLCTNPPTVPPSLTSDIHPPGHYLNPTTRLPSP